MFVLPTVWYIASPGSGLLGREDSHFTGSEELLFVNKKTSFTQRFLQFVTKGQLLLFRRKHDAASLSKNKDQLFRNMRMWQEPGSLDGGDDYGI